jgi:hypothetical protein
MISLFSAGVKPLPFYRMGNSGNVQFIFHVPELGYIWCFWIARLETTQKHRQLTSLALP